jgi:hypothetical protein
MLTCNTHIIFPVFCFDGIVSDSRYCNVVLGGHAYEKGGPLKGKGEAGRVGRVQFTTNQGQEWTGICATAQRRDFQVSKRG